MRQAVFLFFEDRLTGKRVDGVNDDGVPGTLMNKSVLRFPRAMDEPRVIV